MEAYDLTIEILKFLQNNGFAWKILSSSYKIKCKKQTDINLEDLIDEKEPKSEPLNILIQIFSVRIFLF